MDDAAMKYTLLLPLFFLLGATTPPSATPQKPKEAAPSRPKLIIAPSSKQAPLAEPISSELFFYPGVVVGREGRWVGGDNFLNISKKIPIQVNFIKAEGVDFSVSQEKIQALVASLFEKGGITPAGDSSDTKPPLPFFSLVILIFPNGDGLAAACQGRLFEQVQVARVQLKDEVFQAITWEQTNLVFGAQDQFEKQLEDTVKELVNTFISRVNAQQQGSGNSKAG